MTIDPEVLDRIDLKRAAAVELRSATRLLPRRADLIALERVAGEVATALRNRYRKAGAGSPADTIFADKDRRGRRPLSEMTLDDRVLYRALVSALSDSLPEHVVKREPYEKFVNGPLLISGAAFVSKTDVTAYYQFIDHERLSEELIEQTGESLIVDELLSLLGRIMGSRVGIPQVHHSSDILGDAYIDIARRRLRRAGFHVMTYSDDFRIVTDSLAAAREALEACAQELRALGLAPNESKTYTYRLRNYEDSLGAFKRAQEELFADEATEELELLLLGSYEDDNAIDDAEASDEDENSGSMPGSTALIDSSTLPPGDALGETDIVERGQSDIPSDAQVNASERALELWLDETSTSSPHGNQDAAIIEALVGSALPILGRAARRVSVQDLSMILRNAPDLTPHVASYLMSLARTGDVGAAITRETLDLLVTEQSFSTWQQVWLAHSAGNVDAVTNSHAHYAWLQGLVERADAALAATAACALGRLGLADARGLAARLDKIGPVWRLLLLAAIGMQDPSEAQAASDGKLDRLLLENLRG